MMLRRVFSSLHLHIYARNVQKEAVMDCHLEGISIHYEVFGEGKPLLVLHGSVGDHHYWQTTLEPLFEKREGWKRIYLDLPGHGGTSAPEWLETEDQILDVLLQFVDQIIPGERFALAGFSWGGFLARGILHERFSQIEGLLLIAPEIRSLENDVPPRTILHKDEKVVSAELDGQLRELMENLVVAQDRATRDRLRWVQPALQMAERDDAAFPARLQRNFSFTVDEMPHLFEQPTLFLLGRQDHLVGYRRSWKLIEQFPRATFAVLDRAGHGIAGMELAELCASLIREWLNRVEEASQP
jgi:pimeloyl-ACP methyl ester carboxylesterase